jgi:hypothetical protein
LPGQVTGTRKVSSPGLIQYLGAFGDLLMDQLGEVHPMTGAPIHARLQPHCSHLPEPVPGRRPDVAVALLLRPQPTTPTLLGPSHRAVAQSLSLTLGFNEADSAKLGCGGAACSAVYLVRGASRCQPQRHGS